MSKFLAPIHSWLYNKIAISEELETKVLKTLQLEEDPFVTDLYARVGAQLPDAPLEDLIDQSNIHGWLQNRIQMTESRLAELITWQVQKSPAARGTLHQIWELAGADLAASVPAMGNLKAEDLYKLTQDIILEGMPCDRVSQITASSETSVEWLTTQCLHRQHFDAAGGDVSHYYALRESFLNGFLSIVQPGARYTVKESPAGSGAAYINHITIQ